MVIKVKHASIINQAITVAYLLAATVAITKANFEAVLNGTGQHLT
jgi:hypothetical protein